MPNEYFDPIIYDPNYQNNLYMIESALQSVGMNASQETIYPDIFDDQLRALIAAVPLE